MKLTQRFWSFLTPLVLILGTTALAQSSMSEIAPIWNANATPAQRQAVTSRAKQYFSAVLHGDLKTLDAITTPDFIMITLEGQPLNAKQLIAKAKKLRFEYGDATTGLQIVAGKTDGKVVGVLVTVQYAAPKLTGEGGMGGGGSAFSTTHRLIWNRSGSDWKLAQDAVTEQYNSSL